jgi:hypothetical protein
MPSGRVPLLTMRLVDKLFSTTQSWSATHSGVSTVSRAICVVPTVGEGWSQLNVTCATLIPSPGAGRSKVIGTWEWALVPAVTLIVGE